MGLYSMGDYMASDVLTNGLCSENREVGFGCDEVEVAFIGKRLLDQLLFYSPMASHYT